MKMYILVRKDLSPSQQGVQACHAVADLCCENLPSVQKWARDHKTMVLLGVKNQDELTQWSDKLKNGKIDHRMFFEPDVDQFTALAVDPGTDPNMFKELNLLRI